MSIDEKYSELSERRNKLEPKLRAIVLDKLISRYGKSKAKEYILEIMGNKTKNKIWSLVSLRFT
ncbi:hypothetical protein HMSSN139_12010 [Paenibacillus sp. HMSSN-139]|nr:hypothetical protein HMSSN139_12010 [Paenibacillus sp. HMSSN-139]